jgi:TatD DNase family protein
LLYQDVYTYPFQEECIEKPNALFSDAHCHLNLFEDPAEVISDAEMNGVGLIVASGASAKDNKEVAKIVGENVFGVVGIDPEHVSDAAEISELRGMIEKSKNLVGIGEIGLDRKIAKDESYFEKEKEIFVKQLELAEQLGLPVVIHSRGALEDVLAILKDFKLRAMFHFFEGDEKDVKKIGNNIISIPPVESSKRRRAIKEVSINSIVLETDSPIVGRNPVDVKISASIVAKARNMPLEEVVDLTTENLRNFFYI